MSSIATQCNKIVIKKRLYVVLIKDIPQQKHKHEPPYTAPVYVCVYGPDKQSVINLLSENILRTYIHNINKH